MGRLKTQVRKRVTVALLPCGHATFCQQCIDTFIATNSHCPVCRCAVSTTVRFYNELWNSAYVFLILFFVRFLRDAVYCRMSI